MARILVTGSADGLGLMAAALLIEQGHEVTAHARSDERAAAARAAAPGAAAVLVGDLASIAAVRELAAGANSLGRYDGVIHNAAVGYREQRSETVDGLEHVFAINVLAPYLLTALMTPPARLVYLSSGMHRGGDADLGDLQWRERPWDGSQAYADSKLWDTVLAFAVARRWGEVCSNAVEPGWVATKMGGPGAPDDLSLAAVTQAWLAAGDDPASLVSGRYLYHQRERHPPGGARHLRPGGAAGGVRRAERRRARLERRPASAVVAPRTRGRPAAGRPVAPTPRSPSAPGPSRS
jgi:NAD(P)-dependent dehydrogenase (short-subunit alcohol dehydrogenase family)